LPQGRECVLDAGDSEAGASVHFVTNELDSGAVILQKSVVIDPSDNAEILAKKVLKQEHILCNPNLSIIKVDFARIS
jgi:phosphoribosylglycinamide formyltransferase-1